MYNSIYNQCYNIVELLCAVYFEEVPFSLFLCKFDLHVHCSLDNNIAFFNLIIFFNHMIKNMYYVLKQN